MPNDFKLKNGQRIELTDAEQAERNADITAWNNGAFDRALENLRAKRNKDLTDSDWTQLPDTTLTAKQKSDWQVFRTELRNITDGLTTVEDVNNVDYPDKPNG